MKLPFDLGVKLVFRLLVPGFFVMLGVRPILLTLLDASGARDYHDLGCMLAVLVFGWVVTLADMPIYMLFEGRRFWPQRLWLRGVRSEEARLDRWRRSERWNYEQWKAHHSEIHLRRYQEASVELRRFPIDESNGEYVAVFPTRFGNAVTAFEQYPKTRYGADAMFYLARIWLALDKDTKDELDTQQAVADSALYSCVALVVTGGLWAIFGVLRVANAPLPYTATASLALLSAVVSFAASVWLYGLAIYANDQFGLSFRALFDLRLSTLGQTLLAPNGVLATVTTITGDGAPLRQPVREQYGIVWRYLHNYRVKCPRCGKIVPPPQFPSHDCPPLWKTGNSSKQT
jgi:hypothetical protein